MRIILFILIVFFPWLSCAETIYQQTNPNGSVTYSDTPLKNSRVINIPSSSSAPIQTPAPSSQKAEEIPAAAPNTPYTVFTMTSPTDQDTFQNQRLIPVQLHVEPDLQNGDKIQLVIDGSPYGTPAAATQLAIGQLDRGTHTLAATILDKDNTVIKRTPPITIYMHYAQLGTTPLK